MPKNNKSLRKLIKKYPLIFAILREQDYEANLKKQNIFFRKLNELAEKMVMVKCPECQTLQVGYNDFYECKVCNYLITDSEFEEVEQTCKND